MIASFGFDRESVMDSEPPMDVMIRIRNPDPNPAEIFR